MSVPRLYASKLSTYTITASAGEAAGFPVSNLKTYFPDQKWKTAALTDNQTLTIDFGSAVTADALVLDQHNFLNDNNIIFEAATDSGFTTGVVQVSTDLIADTPIASENNDLGTGNTRSIYHFASMSKRYWRLKFQAGGAPGLTWELGQIFICARMDMPYTYDFPYKKGNPSFVTAEAVALDGRIRTSQAYGGRTLNEFKFSLINDAARTAWITFISTVRGKLFPFYFLDADGSTMYYGHLDADYDPVSTERYQLNTIETFRMKNQMADVT